MSESLRMRVVKALRPYIDQRHSAGLALDAMLDCLAENATEWRRAAWQGDSAFASATVDDLLEALREDR